MGFLFFSFMKRTKIKAMLLFLKRKLGVSQLALDLINIQVYFQLFDLKQLMFSVSKSDNKLLILL
jgi:hypothetical protein